MPHLFRFLAFLVFVGACAATSNAQTPAGDDLIFVIRVDDILSRSAIEPRDLASIEETVERHGGLITWAVIPHRLIEPQNADGVLAADLARSVLRGHEIALHGYVHICDLCGESSHEMYCKRRETSFDRATQEELIAAGHRILEEYVGLVPESFVPPGHAYDETTLDVLAGFGHRVLSVPGSHGQHVRPGLFNIEPTDEYTWALTEASFDNALERAIRDIEGAEGYFQLLLHDPFTRSGYGNGITLRWLDTLLDEVNERFGSRVRYLTLTGAADVLASRQVSLPASPTTWDIRVSAYPNPAHDVVEIRVRPSSHPGLITVVDATGRVRSTQTMPAFEDVTVLDVATLPSGTYFFRLETADQRVIGSFSVVR